MKYTGVVRRVDDLGRIVIPKEIRKTAKIKDGDPLEFIIDNENIVLKRYYPLEKWVSLSQNVANSIKDVLEKECFIIDQNKVVATTQAISDVIGKNATENLLTFIKEKQTALINRKDTERFFPLIEGCDFNENSRIIVPIVSKENVCGAIVVLALDNAEELCLKDVNAIRICTNVLSSLFN